MTAEILRLTNSAYFSTPAKVTSTMHAVRTLGIEIIQSLVLRIGIFRQFAGSANVMPLLKELNEYSLSVARLAETVAKAESMDHFVITSAQCAGMLSSIGILVLLDAKGAEFRALLGRVRPDESLFQAEREAFGVDHHLIGAYLLSLWGFSDAVIEAVALAPVPGLATGHENQALTAVHVALALAPRFPALPKGVEGRDILDRDYLRSVGRDGRVEAWQALAEPLPGKE